MSLQSKNGTCEPQATDKTPIQVKEKQLFFWPMSVYFNSYVPSLASVSVSAQHGIVALGKAHTRSAPSLSSLPKVALEIVPIFALLNTDRSRPQRVECRPSPESVRRLAFDSQLGNETDISPWDQSKIALVPSWCLRPLNSSIRSSRLLIMPLFVFVCSFYVSRSDSNSGRQLCLS